MFNKIGSYIVNKVTKSVVGKAVRYGFWSLLFFCPGAMIGAVGYTGVVVSAAAVHSGLVEYGASSLIVKKLE